MYNDIFFFGFLVNFRFIEGNLWIIFKEFVFGYFFFVVVRDFKMEEVDIEVVKIDNEKYNNVREIFY